MKNWLLRCKTFGLVLALLPIFFATVRVEAATLLFVPLDDRPVCLQYTVETLQAAGHEVLTPPEELLSTRGRSGDPDKLWEWVLANAGHAHRRCWPPIHCFTAGWCNRASTRSMMP